MKSPTPNSPLVTNSVYLIPITIFATKFLEIIFDIIGWNFITPPDEYGNTFISNFIEWFGVLYGILLPLILVRVWEQLDDIDREFDREADTIRIFYEDLTYLEEDKKALAREIATLLQKYILHVIENYKVETKELIDDATEYEIDNRSNLSFFEQIKLNFDYILYSMGNSLKKLVTPEGDPKLSQIKRREGDAILEEIRTQLRILVRPMVMASKVSQFLVPELLGKLNEIIDIRGDRIAYSSQRLFGSLRVIALVTSIMFVVPFYFVGFSFSAGLLDNILTVGVTLLVIFIYLIIEDFDEPFGGTWRTTDDSWTRVRNYINNHYQEIEISEKKQSNTRQSKKYAPLAKYLLSKSKDSSEITMTFNKIENIIKEKLPRSAEKSNWWKKTPKGNRLQAGAWLNAGWKIKEIDIPNQKITFKKDV